MLREVPFLVDRLLGSLGSIGLDECNSKLMEGLKTLKSCGEILISHPKLYMKMFYSLVVNTSSMKQYLTETHEHNFEIHNIVLPS